MAPRSITFTSLSPNRVWARRSKSTAQSDEVKQGTIVGKDNTRNRAIANTGSNQPITTTSKEAQYGTSVIINRPESRTGGRSFSITTSRIISRSEDIGLTQAYEDTTSNITGCTDNDPSNFNNNPPDPPDPDPDPDPAPPAPPGAPTDPVAPPEPTPTPNGCAPTDEDQWYNAPGPGSQYCPAGTTYKGFAELPAGEFKVLCGGPSRPPGDGCPVAPVGYSCSNGTCVETDNGTYATIEECQAADCSSSALGYVCTSGNCTEVPLSQATYATLEECQANCSAPGPRYDIVNGLCVESSGGTYGSATECSAFGGQSPTGDPPPSQVSLEARCIFGDGLITDWNPWVGLVTPIRVEKGSLSPGNQYAFLLDANDDEYQTCGSGDPEFQPVNVEIRNVQEYNP